MTEVTFPIIRHISENGHNFDRVINENDRVNCFFCNYSILIDYRTVHVARDGMQMVDCPACERHVSVLYYFDQVDKNRKKPVKVKFHRGQRMKVGGL